MMTSKVARDAFDQGVYILSWYDTLIIAPPLIITQDVVDEAIDIIDKSLLIADREAVSTDIPVSKTSEFAGI